MSPRSFSVEELGLTFTTATQIPGGGPQEVPRLRDEVPGTLQYGFLELLFSSSFPFAQIQAARADIRHRKVELCPDGKQKAVTQDVCQQKRMTEKMLRESRAGSSPTLSGQRGLVCAGSH